MLSANFKPKTTVAASRGSLVTDSMAFLFGLAWLALEPCPLNKSETKALDYAHYSSFSKIFRTKSKDSIDQCMLLFGCPSVLTAVNKRKGKFLTNYFKSRTSLCLIFAHVAQNELKDLPSCTTAST